LDNRFNALGHFMLFTRLNPGGSTVVGELWVEYEWEFEVPVINEALLPAISGAIIDVGINTEATFVYPRVWADLKNGGGTIFPKNPSDGIITTRESTTHTTMRLTFHPLTNYVGKWLVYYQGYFNDGNTASSDTAYPIAGSLISTPLNDVAVLNLAYAYSHMDLTGTISNWNIPFVQSAIVEVKSEAIHHNVANTDLILDFIMVHHASTGNVTDNAPNVCFITRLTDETTMVISGLPNAVLAPPRPLEKLWAEVEKLKQAMVPPVLSAEEPLETKTFGRQPATPGRAPPTIFMAREPRAQSLPPAVR
jgi:hypothetical protein